MKRFPIFLSFLMLCSGLFWPRCAGATSGLRVTDVKPRAFSLVWLANQAAVSCSAKVYADPEGQVQINGFRITDESAAHPPAAQNGVMKVMVSGETETLTPETTYYFQIVTTSAQGTLVEPSSGSLPSVKTEASSVYVDNDVLLHRILMNDGTTPALGTLLLIEVREGKGDYPVTGWVDDGYSAPLAAAELINIYSAVNHRNLELFGGESLTVQSIGGLLGFRQMTATVPERIGGGSPQSLSPTPSDEQCTLDNAGPVIDSGQLLPVPGAVINDSTPVISGVYADQLSAIDPGSVVLKVDGLPVTGQAVVSSTGVVYTPLVPLAEGAHSVELFVADEWGYEALPMTWSFTIDLTQKGDVNSDESIDLADAIISLQVVSGIQPVSPVYRAADVNGDGKIGMEEAIFILQKISGLRP
jgi:hypothetical protein